MQATFTPRNSRGISKPERTITLPFAQVTARALIVRRRNGAILGMQHHKGARYALPGGHVEDGEATDAAVLRELEEENVTLHGVDPNWRERLAVDYFHGYRELALWYVMIVDDGVAAENDETIDSRWIAQDEDVWHPLMRERLLLILRNYAPEFVQAT